MASITLDTSPELMGFFAVFFSTSWDLVKREVLEVVNEMRATNSLPSCWTHSVIMLIPKKTTLASLANFWPISLCSTIYKISAKIVGNWLATMLLKLISLNHGAFVRGRSIFDNISLA